MEVATGALSSLLPMLANMLKDEYRMQTDLKDQVESLSKELKSTLITLQEVERVPRNELDDQCKNWATNLREASYDMEDVLDTFLIRVDGVMQHADPNKVKQFMKKMGERLIRPMARRDIANKIQGILKKLKDIAERHSRYAQKVVQSRDVAVTGIDHRLKALYRDYEKEIVGIDGPVNELANMLNIEDQVGMYVKKMKIVSVYGFGGIGKTTLAKSVHKKFQSKFKAQAFVLVGRNPALNNVLIDILFELTKHRENTMKSELATLNQQQLVDQIRDFLKVKRYFIVIDDLWEADPWTEAICFALYDNNLGSRIIITTRKHDVAKDVENRAAKEVGYSYEMKPLSNESSKGLFYKRIFGSGKCPENFSEISRKILSKCGGVPLAITSISSLLASKSENNVDEWSHICESIGFGNSPDMDEMRKILSLSYYDLPSDLKSCLLYLSIFPEDYKIRKDRLVWRWIAEGFIQHGVTKNHSLFEVGESCFNELMNRNLILPSNIDKEGMPQACHVHDVVLDLIHSLLMEENFITTIVDDDTKQNKLSQISTVRRLSLYCNAWPEMDMSKLRSLTIFNVTIVSSMPSHPGCDLLRVLDLEGCYLGGNNLNLRFIRRLVHLRYIGLRNTLYSNDLPLKKLQFLQTLNLIGTGIKELPSSVVRLGQLMCLYVDQSIRLPKGLRTLTSLEVLEAACVDSASIAEDLGHLSQLRQLVVDLGSDKKGRLDKGMCKAFAMSLGKLRKLQSLQIFSAMQVELEGSVEKLEYLGYLRIEKTTFLPTWISRACLPRLSHLEITVGKLRGADMEVLGKLLALRVLEVDVSGTGVKQVVEKFTVGIGAFPCLTKCRFCAYGVLPSMFAAPGAMPKLERLVFVILLDNFSEFQDLAMDRFSSLQSVRVALYGSRITRDEGIKVQDALKRAANVHRNSPTIDIDDYALYSDLLEAEEAEVGPTGQKLFSLFQAKYQMIQDDPTVLERIFSSNLMSDLINSLDVLPFDFASLFEDNLLGEMNIDISGRPFGSVLQDVIRRIISKQDMSQVIYKMMSGTISQTDLCQMMSQMGFNEDDINRVMSQSQTTISQMMMSQPDLSGMALSPVDINRVISQMDFSPVDMASWMRLIVDRANSNTGS